MSAHRALMSQLYVFIRQCRSESYVLSVHHIGQYRIVKKLGAGGMGTVLLGEHILLGRRAAIKTLRPELCAQSEIVERFFNEARATSAIADPGVVQVYDFGYSVDGTAYIVMELLEGEGLGARIGRLGKLPIQDTLRVARQVASSLAAAHARDIIHRDLKPDNVFLIRDAEVDGGERAKVFDFGICKRACDPLMTLPDTMLGTPIYMSPEQCRGAGPVDHRADIYALGCMMFEMLVGDPPFSHDGLGEVIAAHMLVEPPRPSSRMDALPDAVDDLVMRCLAKAPDDRFASMGDLIAAIERVGADLWALSLPAAVVHELDTATTLGPATPTRLADVEAEVAVAAAAARREVATCIYGARRDDDEPEISIIEAVDEASGGGEDALHNPTVLGIGVSSPAEPEIEIVPADEAGPLGGDGDEPIELRTPSRRSRSSHGVLSHSARWFAEGDASGSQPALHASAVDRWIDEPAGDARLRRRVLGIAFVGAVFAAASLGAYVAARGDDGTFPAPIRAEPV
ncbi:MAG: serine/threonine protein kinase, partial [Deltaproteobacteria bacterium]|nr:serine/threonine protein kinase [Deltaproteobacteria bacterium]